MVVHNNLLDRLMRIAGGLRGRAPDQAPAQPLALLMAVLTLSLAPIAAGATRIRPNANTAWEENLRRPFSSAGIYGLQQTYVDGRVVLADIQRKNGSSHAQFNIPLTQGYDYLQMDLASVRGSGYRSFSLKMSGTQGDLGDGTEPGLYTYDLMAAYPPLAYQKIVPMSLYVAGGRTTQTPVPPGPRFSFHSMRLIRRPTEGLVVKLVKGATIKKGSKLRLTVWTTAGTKDVTVEFLWAGYKAVSFTAQSYVQLKATDAKATKWTADVTVTRLRPPSGMGVVQAKAVVVGGKRDRLYSSIPYPLQGPG